MALTNSRPTVLTFLLLALVSCDAVAQVDDAQARITVVQAASAAQQDGKLEDAFIGFARVPGAQHLAVNLARDKPQKYIAILRKHSDDVPAALAKVIEGDLLLAGGLNSLAVAAYRHVAKLAAKSDRQSWADGVLPRRSYVVDPGSGTKYTGSNQLLNPFTLGPGSHRDNLLIRRLIALEAWDDAEREFDRVWQIHVENSRPHFVLIPKFDQQTGKVIPNVKHLMEPAGFNGHGLQMALDYAFFLQRMKKGDAARKILLQAMMRIDFDLNPSMLFPVAVPAEKEDADYPLLKSDAGELRGLWRGGYSSGVSRKEFVRLAFGFFKQTGHDVDLVQELSTRIDAGENRVRRLFARIKLHQGLTDDAVQLELDYIKHGKFDSLTSAYRRGLVFEDAKEPRKAADEFESALKQPVKSLRLPDPDEQANGYGKGQFSAMAFAGFGARGFQPDISERQVHADLLVRLERLYAGLGESLLSYRVRQRQVELQPRFIQDVGFLQRMKQHADTLDRSVSFRAWLQNRLTRDSSATDKAAVHWVLGEHIACAKAVAAFKPKSHRDNSFKQWSDRFRSLGHENYQQFLDAQLEVDPDHVMARMQRFGDKATTDQDKIRTLELLLKSGGEFAISPHPRRIGSSKVFTDHFDMAYQLLRLYERGDQLDKLRQLGLRMAAGEKPFEKWWDVIHERGYPYQYRSMNMLPDHLNACFAVVIQHADAATLEQLRELWKDRDDFPAKRQLARRLAGKLTQPIDGTDVRWANVPGGVRLVVSDEHVRCLSTGDDRVCAGHSWGVSVWDWAGQPLMRVALQEPVMALAVGKGVIWAGTTRGLYRIRMDDWSVSHIWLHDDVPAELRHDRSSDEPRSFWFDNRVYALELDGDDLWITLHRNIQRLNTSSLALRAYSYRELSTESWLAHTQILLDGRYVWVGGGHGPVLQYDRETDRWRAVVHGKYPTKLIGKIKGHVLITAHMDDTRRYRPAIVDRDSLKLDVFKLDRNSTNGRPAVDGPLHYFGELQGQPALGHGGPSFVLDLERRTIRRVEEMWDVEKYKIDGPLFPGFRSGELWWTRRDDGTVIVRSRSWTLMTSATGQLVTAADYQHNANPFSASSARARRRLASGLQFEANARDVAKRATQEFAERHSDPARPETQVQTTNSLLGEIVFDVINDSDRNRKWLATDGGLAMLDGDDRVVAKWKQSDGLCSNRVTGGVATKDRAYFSTAWADHGGGLIVYDPSTQLFTGRYTSDGLATNKLAGVIATEPGKLRLTYAAEYRRHVDSKYQVHRPGIFDPRTDTVQSGGSPATFRSEQSLPTYTKGPSGDWVPLLGGHAYRRLSIDGKTYIPGSHGLVIVDEAKFGTPDKLAKWSIADVKVKLTADPHLAWRQAARRVKINPFELKDIVPHLDSKNPYLRARAFQTAMQHYDRHKNAAPFLQPAIKALKLDDLRTRATAAQLLALFDDSQQASDALRTLRGDEHEPLQILAAVELTERGEPPLLQHFETVLKATNDNYQWLELPLGLNSKQQVANDVRVHKVLAKNASPDVFKLLMKYPPSSRANEQYMQAVYAPLAQSLLRQPKVAATLLKANHKKHQHPNDREFARHTFRLAGDAILPVLHEALRSTDRVVRSNAARACGSIGNADSIPLLIDALNLESGLSRASIVWALGELKARDSLSQLADLYVDARNDQQNRAGSGFRMSQSAAVMQAQYTQISDLNAIGRDWDELKSTTPQVDPIENEWLLTPEMILEAVRKIGPEASPVFYRRLAADTDQAARVEAAVQLAASVPTESEANIRVLRGLLSDRMFEVQTAAAASLLILGDDSPQRQILVWLKLPDYTGVDVLRQLDRVTDGGRLSFAQGTIENMQFPPSNGAYQSPQEVKKRVLARIRKAVKSERQTTK